MIRVEDFRAAMPRSNPPRRIGNFFSFKIQETCTLTKFVEQKLSLCVKKPTNVMARSHRSRHDICWFLKSCRVCGEIFYISPRLARSRRAIRLFLYLAKILKDTNFLPRLPKYNPIIPRWNE